MKLGTETGSLTNHLYSRGVIGQPEPVVGMGATVLYWTDRHGATITKVWIERGDTYVTTQDDHATRTDKNGMSESQTYEFSPNPNGSEHTFRMSVTGRWQEVRKNPTTKRWNKTHGPGLRVGERAHYHDFSF